MRLVSEEKAVQYGEYLGVEKIYHIGDLGYVRFELFPEKAMLIHPVLNKFTLKNFRIFRKVCIELGIELAEYYGYSIVSVFTENTKLANMYGKGILKRVITPDGVPMYVAYINEVKKLCHK